MQEPNITRIVTFGKLSRKKWPWVQEALMKHVLFLTIVHNINTRQQVATNHHIWLLTSKLTKKTASITTYFVIADFVVNNVLL